MSFSYDISLSGEKDKLRFLLSDTVQSSAVFQDEEIGGILNIQSNVFLAAALLAYSRATALATSAIQYIVGAGVRDALSIDRRAVPKFWMDLSSKMEQMALTQDSNYEFLDRFAFDIAADGRDFSDYQGFSV
jgi:hypothetical protein